MTEALGICLREDVREDVKYIECRRGDGYS